MLYSASVARYLSGTGQSLVVCTRFDNLCVRVRVRASVCACLVSGLTGEY